MKKLLLQSMQGLSSAGVGNNGLTECTDPTLGPRLGTKSLRGGGVAVLEPLIQRAAMTGLNIWGQELYLEEATLSTAPPVCRGLRPPEALCLGLLRLPRWKEYGSPSPGA